MDNVQKHNICMLKVVGSGAKIENTWNCTSISLIHLCGMAQTLLLLLIEFFMYSKTLIHHFYQGS
jgi:hypothetical protein